VDVSSAYEIGESSQGYVGVPTMQRGAMAASVASEAAALVV
jgi:hypothetical protein